MSRKRSLKKQQKRQESLLERLEELYQRGGDDELLALAAEQAPDIAASSFGPKWAEAADRALRQSLARADFGRLERLLSSLRRSGQIRPLANLARLSEAVLDLAAGRREAARARRAGLPPAISAAHPASSEEKTGCKDEVRTIYQALQALSHEVDPEALGRGFQSLRAAARVELVEPAEQTALSHLLDNAGRCLSLLDDLTSLENKLAEGDGASRRVAAWLRGSGRLLAAALSPSGPPLFAPLRYAVHMRWRAVLERVKAREGPPGLAALCIAHPALLAHDVDLPGGIQGSLAVLRQREQARQLLAARRFEDLAALLRSRSRSTSESGELAVLWSLELWACNHRPMEDEEGDDEDLFKEMFDDITEEPPGHRALARLEEMAGEIRRHFSAERRAEVARVLRAELFDLCEQLNLCDHTAGAALHLLEHLPGDVGLLIAGVAGAIAGESPRALRALEAQLSHAGKAQAGDRALVERLMAQVAHEAPGDIAHTLATLKSLFAAETWREITALVAREAGGTLVRSLLDVCFEALQGPAAGGLALAETRRGLNLLRPVLTGTPGFAAMQLILDCWLQDRRAVERRLKAFLMDDPGIESALIALQLLEKASGPWAPRGVGVAFGGLTHAVIDRIDHGQIGWQLWFHAAPLLAFSADPSDRKRLDKKIRQILSSPPLPGEDREDLNRALLAVERIEAMKEERRPQPPRPKRKKPRRGRAGGRQLLLDLP